MQILWAFRCNPLRTHQRQRKIAGFTVCGFLLRKKPHGFAGPRGGSEPSPEIAKGNFRGA
jgi:hypothetical protein